MCIGRGVRLSIPDGVTTVMISNLNRSETLRRLINHAINRVSASHSSLTNATSPELSTYWRSWITQSQERSFMMA